MKSFDDKPIGHTKDGRPVFDNTATVACVLVRHAYGLVTVRRNTDPGKGLLGLPGGYQMYGESWRECASRELWEETGLNITGTRLVLREVVTDQYNNNVLFCSYPTLIGDPPRPNEFEVMELKFISDPEQLQLDDWAFPTHWAAAVAFLGGFYR